MISRIAALGAALGLALTGLAVGTASASTGLSHTVAISGNLDNGGHGYWSRLDYNRTAHISKGSTEDTWNVLLKDSGSFRTMPGTRSPGAGVPITRAEPGSFYGTFQFVVTSKTAPTRALVRQAYNFRCNPAVPNRGDCSGMPQPTSNWPALYFGKDAQVAAGAWSWSYRTCAERRTDGSGGSSGDITGKRCSVKVTADAPTVTSPDCGETRGRLTIPSDRGVTYVAYGKRFRTTKSGAHAVWPGTYKVVAKAKDGYRLYGRTSWTLTVNAPAACPTPTPTPTVSPSPTPTVEPTVTPTIVEVTPVEPTLEQATCATEGISRITIPDVKGVIYKSASGEVLQDRYTVQPGEVTVKAEAAEGYVLKDGAKAEWTFVVNDPPAVCPGPQGEDGEDGEDGQDGRDGIVVNGVRTPTRIDTGLGGTA
jgi:hypothetical protein